MSGISIIDVKTIVAIGQLDVKPVAKIRSLDPITPNTSYNKPNTPFSSGDDAVLLEPAFVMTPDGITHMRVADGAYVPSINEHVSIKS